MKPYIYIPVGDLEVLIDRQDYTWIRRMNLSVGKTGYVYCHYSLLHRHVMNLTYDGNVMVDHINGNKLDNRRKNLRICSSHENTTNRVAPLTIRKHSRYNGVSRADKRVKLQKKWSASIRFKGKTFYLGHWGTEEEAALAYDKAVRKFLPSNKRKLNFPNRRCRLPVPNVDYNRYTKDEYFGKFDKK